MKLVNCSCTKKNAYLKFRQNQKQKFLQLILYVYSENMLMCLYLIYKISMCNKIKLLYTKMISENAWRVLTCRCTIAQQDTHIHTYSICICMYVRAM